jgi:hypothetical protein
LTVPSRVCRGGKMWQWRAAKVDQRGCGVVRWTGRAWLRRPRGSTQLSFIGTRDPGLLRGLIAAFNEIGFRCATEATGTIRVGAPFRLDRTPRP